MRRKPKYLHRKLRQQWESLARQHYELRQRVSELFRQQATARLIAPEHDPLMKTLD